MGLEREVTLELLTDLATAIRGVTKTILPDMPIDVTVSTGAEPGINIRVRQATVIYPTFIHAKAVLRPTDHYRRLLGLPERGA